MSNVIDLTGGSEYVEPDAVTVADGTTYDRAIVIDVGDRTEEAALLAAQAIIALRMGQRYPTPSNSSNNGFAYRRGPYRKRALGGGESGGQQSNSVVQSVQSGTATDHEACNVSGFDAVAANSLFDLMLTQEYAHATNQNPWVMQNNGQSDAYWARIYDASSLQDCTPGQPWPVGGVHREESNSGRMPQGTDLSDFL